jgi:hypothetical protein
VSVYFIRATSLGLVKIGFAEDVWKRFSKIQSDNPCELMMAAFEEGDKRRERELHLRFSADRERGEWFRFSAQIEAHVAALQTPIRTRRDFSNGPSALAKAIGISPAYASMLKSGVRPWTRALAIAAYRKTGAKIGPIAPATDAEIDVLEWFEDRAA